MKKSKLLLIAGIIGTAYAIYLVSYFLSINDASISSSEQLGATLATALVMPHMAIVWIAVIFNWLGFFLNARWGALVAGVLYAVAILFFFLYFMFVIVEMILCFVAFGKMKKNQKEVIKQEGEVQA